MERKFNFMNGIIITREEGYILTEKSVDDLFTLFEEFINGKTISEMGEDKEIIPALLAVAWNDLWTLLQYRKEAMEIEEDTDVDEG